MLETNNGMDALRNRAQAKKVLDFLRGSAIIEEKVVAANGSGTEAGEITEVMDDAADEAADLIEMTAAEEPAAASVTVEGGTE